MEENVSEKGKGGSKKGKRTRGKSAKASRGNWSLRLFSGRRERPLLVGIMLSNVAFSYMIQFVSHIYLTIE